MMGSMEGPLSGSSFSEYMRRIGHHWDAGYALAIAARSQMLSTLAGSDDQEHAVPVERWAAEAGPSVRALARQTLAEWEKRGVPSGQTEAEYIAARRGQGVTGDIAKREILAYRDVCRQAPELLGDS
jgi:hypothetical protein